VFLVISFIFVRHGSPEPFVDSQPDKDRRLVKRGIKQMKRVAELLEDINVEIDRILSSPFLRAYQSADVISEDMKLEANIETVPDLEPDRDPSGFMTRIKEFDNIGCLVVSHQPVLRKLLRTMTGAEIEIGKGAVVLVDYDPSNGESVIRMVIDQKVLQR